MKTQNNPALEVGPEGSVSFSRPPITDVKRQILMRALADSEDLLAGLRSATS